MRGICEKQTVSLATPVSQNTKPPLEDETGMCVACVEWIQLPWEPPLGTLLTISYQLCALWTIHRKVYLLYLELIFPTIKK